MKDKIKEIEDKLDELDPIINKENNAYVFIVGGETTGNVNASLAGDIDVLVSVIHNAIENNEDVRDIIMTAMFSYISENPEIMVEESIEMPLGENNGSIN